MRAVLTTLFVMLAVTTGVQAQLLNRLSPVKFGIKAGVSMPSLKSSKVSSQIFDASASSGYHFGLQARVSLARFFVQPELVYSSVKADYTLYSYSSRYDKSNRINTIDLPIMVGYKVAGLVRVGGGLAFTLYDNKDGELFNARMPVAKESVTSYMLGAGVDVLSLTLDVRYMGNFKGATQPVYADGKNYNSSLRRGAWQFSVGYMF